MKLHTKYQRPGPSSLTREEFKAFPYTPVLGPFFIPGVHFHHENMPI